MSYAFIPYGDVCQVEFNGKWLDYATIKDAADAAYAEQLVKGERFGNLGQRSFRIIRNGKPLQLSGEDTHIKES